jgi:hypothetical protein
VKRSRAKRGSTLEQVSPPAETACTAHPSPLRLQSHNYPCFIDLTLNRVRVPGTSIGQNPFTETIYFRKYSVYEGFLGENTRLRELRRRRDFGRFWAVVGNLGLFMAVFA